MWVWFVGVEHSCAFWIIIRKVASNMISEQCPTMLDATLIKVHMLLMCWWGLQHWKVSLPSGTSALYLNLTCPGSHILLHSDKSQKPWGIICRHFQNTSPLPHYLATLYKILVRPMPAAVIWDSTSKSVSNFLKSIQHLTLKIASKSWSST